MAPAQYEHLFAGISGGVVSTLLLHPLDLVKIRFAVDDGKVVGRPSYSGLKNAFSTICKTEGVRGLYKGVTPNIAGAGSAWGFYFLFYNKIKTDLQNGDSQVQLSPSAHMIAAAEAGILTLLLTNPIWVVKTRLCLQYEAGHGSAGANPSNALSNTYTGMFDAMKKIVKHEGLRGLYKGFVPGMWGVSHGAVQFMTYEEMKAKYNIFKERPINTKLQTSEYLAFAVLSKLIAAVTTYPYQVVRARLQERNSKYSGSIDCVQRTFKSEGFSGLYKGLTPYLAHVLPNICIVLLIYERFTN